MSEVRIDKNTYSYQLSNQLIFKQSKSEFRSFFSNDEKDSLIKVFREVSGGEIFNGENIRLDQIKKTNDKTELTISSITFFDFIMSNMALYKYDEMKNVLVHSTMKDKEILIAKLEKFKENHSHFSSFESIIECKYLSNAIATSTLVKDVDGVFGIVKRSNKVGIGSNLYSVTATGALDGEDFKHENPITSNVKKELKEELNIDLALNNIQCTHIVVSKKKLQPVVLISIELPYQWSDILSDLKQAKDFDFEINKFEMVNKEDIKDLIASENMTDAARYHLSSVI